MRQYCGVIDCMFRKLSLPRDRVEQGLLYRWTEHWPIHSWKSAHWVDETRPDNFKLDDLSRKFYHIFSSYLGLQRTLWPLLSVPSVYRVVLEQSIRQREAMKVDMPCLDSTSKRVAPQKKLYIRRYCTTHTVLSMCMAILCFYNPRIIIDNYMIIGQS